MAMNYQKSKDLLTGRCHKSRKIGHNTYLQRRNNNQIAVLFHSTDIITFTPADTAILSSGGWRTVTTKDRLNRFAPCQIYQEAGIWYIGDWRNKNGNPEFFDGIEINCNTGLPINARPIDSTKKNRAIIKKIKAYADLVVNSCPIPDPGPGDCWFCHMIQVESGRPLGEVIQNTNHLLLHFKEKYVVPSLVFRACKMYGISQVAWWYLTDKKAQNHFPDVAQRQIKSALIRYLKMQFGIAS